MASLSKNDIRSSATDDAVEIIDMAQLEIDIQKSAPRVIRHMNEDHAASLKAYALAFGRHPDAAKTQSATLTGLDTEGFILELTLTDGSKVEDVMVPYDRRIQSAKELHQIAVDMHLQAFDELGVVYKITSGYWSCIEFKFRDSKLEAKELPGTAIDSVIYCDRVCLGHWYIAAIFYWRY